MTIQPYMRDCYRKEFDATVRTVTDGRFVTLSETYFYPTSGGQPHDTGTLTTADGTEVRVVFVGKSDGSISHQVEPENVLAEGDAVHGIIDWERRHAHMRMHTAAHIISRVFEVEEGARVTGNQLGTEESRIDYELADYDPERMAAYAAEVNAIVARDLPVTSEFLAREEAERRTERLNTLAAGFPDAVREVRLLGIGDFDVQACGGTHVRSTGEIGEVVFTQFKNKGKNNRRVYFTIRT